MLPLQIKIYRCSLFLQMVELDEPFASGLLTSESLSPRRQKAVSLLIRSAYLLHQHDCLERKEWPPANRLVAN